MRFKLYVVDVQVAFPYFHTAFSSRSAYAYGRINTARIFSSEGRYTYDRMRIIRIRTKPHSKGSIRLHLPCDCHVTYCTPSTERLLLSSSSSLGAAQTVTTMVNRSCPRASKYTKTGSDGSSFLLLPCPQIQCAIAVSGPVNASRTRYTRLSVGGVIDMNSSSSTDTNCDHVCVQDGFRRGPARTNFPYAAKMGLQRAKGPVLPC